MAAIDDEPLQKQLPTADETTPLVRKEDDTAITPLPKGQIALLALTRVVEPLGFSILFPFINSFVQQSGQIATEDVGFYVGW